MTGIDNNVLSLARASGLADPISCEALRGGGNNRVFRVSGANGTRLLKEYFREGQATWDRMATEFAFAQYVWNTGVYAAPQPFTQDEQRAVAIYEYIEGKACAANEISLDQVLEAAQFFLDINASRDDIAAVNLNDGAETRFSIEEQCNVVIGRVQRLLEMPIDNDVSAKAFKFVQENLLPTAEALKDQILRESLTLGINSIAKLTKANRCLSPSDFGFHNVLQESDGRLRFFDFEYAGWDDPARMVCDFFWQPEVPIPDAYRPDFQAAALAGFGEEANVRAQLLFPLYGLKWSCIVLNEFNSTDRQRRDFALGAIDKSRLVSQLEKSKQLLLRAQSVYSK